MFIIKNNSHKVTAKILLIYITFPDIEITLLKLGFYIPVFFKFPGWKKLLISFLSLLMFLVLIYCIWCITTKCIHFIWLTVDHHWTHLLCPIFSLCVFFKTKKAHYLQDINLEINTPDSQCKIFSSKSKSMKSIKHINYSRQLPFDDIQTLYSKLELSLRCENTAISSIQLLCVSQNTKISHSNLWAITNDN